jgi:fructosamine-3-kinase
LGGELASAEPLSGGEMEQVLALSLRDGRTAVVKSGPAPRVEAAMLRAIAATGAPTPEVLAADDDLLVLSRLPAGGTLASAWPDLGAVLARLHAGTGARYGWPDPYAFGPLAIPNAPVADWPSFWAERRLLVHVDRLPPDLARRVASLAADLPNRLPALPRPALLHGDLWGGNVVVDARRVSGLVDPAAYHGHAEVDLAMLSLFDGPTGAFYDAYGPLEVGADARRPIYALWPGVVHVALFGESYRPLVERLLRAAGA